MTDQRSFDELRSVAGDVSRETFERLLAFEQAFRRWSLRINLAAPSTLDRLWERHVLDSAQLAPLAPTALRWLDLGSGGGFPGAVLAILLRDRGGRMALVESNRKKASFLQTSLASLDAPVEIHATRIEDARISFEPEIVTARALAPLDRLIGLAMPWLSHGARALFHKGRDYRSEIEESSQLWSFDLIEHRSAIDPQSVILEIANPLPAVGRTD